MSDQPKRPYEQMHKIACGLVERLQGACHRLEIAGSLRRKEKLIGDIEIVAIPIMHTNLFGEPTDTSEVDTLLAGWPITLIRNGQKQKAFDFVGSKGQTYKVDLFLQPDPATWGVNMMVRTGSRDFTQKMVTLNWQGGFMPVGYKVKDARVWRNGETLDTPEETDVFGLWGMDFIEAVAR